MQVSPSANMNVRPSFIMKPYKAIQYSFTTNSTWENHLQYATIKVKYVKSPNLKPIQEQVQQR